MTENRKNKINFKTHKVDLDVISDFSLNQSFSIFLTLRVSIGWDRN